VGTLAYMAPEQISGGEVDARSDIFSFGVVFFEMLTGKTPFRGEHEAALVYSIVHEEPEPIARLRPELPAEVVHVVQRALEKDPAERYQSVADMVIDLRRVLKQTAKLTTTHSVPVHPPHEGSTVPAMPHAVTGPAAPVTPKRSRSPILAGGGVLLVVAAFALYYFVLRDAGSPAAVFSFESMKITRVTSSGKARTAAIAPDGKYIVYSLEDGGKQSLWVRQVATGSTVQIVPPAEAFYNGLTMSGDGNFVFYVVQTAEASSPSLYKIPVLGGLPQKVLEDVRTAVTMSPDATRLAFTRSYAATGEFSLLLANIDGSGERVLASHKGDQWFEGVPSWSPDGRTIACALGSWEGGLHFKIMGVDTESGKERVLNDKRWLTVSGVHWTPDGGALLVQGEEGNRVNSQIWQVRLDGGAPTRLTNDLTGYRSLSLAGDGRSLCVVQEDPTVSVWVVPMANTSDARRITGGRESGIGGVEWVSEERILYSSGESGNWDIWLADLAGAEVRRLTTDPGMDYEPVASADGTFFLYTSLQSGIPNIWRRRMDGSDPKQLTDGGEDYRADISPDGSWFVFDSWDSGPVLVMRAPIAGGTPARLSPVSGTNPVLSPDGSRIAYTSFDDTSRKVLVHIMPASGGASETSFELPSLASRSIRWTRDGKGISYFETRSGVSNIWVRPLAGGAPRQITLFTEDFMASHDWSPGGRQLAVVRYSAPSDVLLMTSEAR
jgi:Tol biopolymer transport system component